MRSSVAAALLLSFAATSASADPAPPPAAPPQPAQSAPVAPAKHETPHELSAAAVPQPTPPPSAIPAPTPEEIRHRRVTVRFDSTRPSTVVERRTSVKEEVGAFLFLPFRTSDATWEQVCVTPCEADLDRFSTYRISPQNKVSASHAFTLPQQTDALHLNVDGGSLLAHRVGQTLTVIGVTAVIVGASLLVVASDFKHPDDARIAGGITGGAGVVLAAIGIPLALATESHVGSDTDHDIASVDSVKLSKSVTLTPRGLAF
jgi:hypothetical protein